MQIEVSGIKRIGHLLKQALPIEIFRPLLKIYHTLVAFVDILRSYIAMKKCERTVERLRVGDKPIRFGFYVVLESMFQMRRVFELMMKDSRFEPFIVVVPRIGYQSGDTEATSEKTYRSLVSTADFLRRGKGAKK